MAKILQLPTNLFISNLWENYKRKKDELTRKKMMFLEEQAYIFFYPQFLKLYADKLKNIVDIPEFYYAEKDARAFAKKIVLDLSIKGRIDRCFKARKAELKKAAR